MNIEDFHSTKKFYQTSICSLHVHALVCLVKKGEKVQSIFQNKIYIKSHISALETVKRAQGPTLKKVGAIVL